MWFIDLLKLWALTRHQSDATSTLSPHKKAHFLPRPQANHCLPTPTPSPLVFRKSYYLLITTMNYFIPTTDNDVFSPWADPLWVTGGHPYTSAPQGNHPTGFNIHEFNATNDMAFSPAPITSMGEFTRILTQDITYPVSKQQYKRRHRLTLLCGRMSLTLGPYQPNVGPVLASATILPVHRDTKHS